MTANDNTPRDEYGRPFGKPLWPGGPILGGKDWRAFVRDRDKRDSERRQAGIAARVRRERGEWEA